MAIWHMIIVTTLAWPVASRADGAPNLLLIAAASSNSPILRVLSCSTNGIREIKELKYQVWYGADGDSAVFLGIDGSPKGEGDHLLVIDRKTMSIVTDKIFPEVHSWSLKVSVANNLAVWSKDSTVYFHSVDAQTGFSYSAINWKTGRAHLIPPSKGIAIYGETFIARPEGFVSVGFNRRIALYSETTRTEIPMPDEDNGYNSFVSRLVYYLPTVGLMEYYKGMHRQFTDADLSIKVASPLEFPSAAMMSQVFVRELDGKPYLIWGGNTDTNLQHGARLGMNEIVIFDPLSKKEIQRITLGGTFSESFQPNLDGSKIYFVKRETGEIFCLDRATQTVTLFAGTRVPGFDSWNRAAILVAN
jgi:hypothetical protein